MSSLLFDATKRLPLNQTLLESNSSNVTMGHTLTSLLSVSPPVLWDNGYRVVIEQDSHT